MTTIFAAIYLRISDADRDDFEAIERQYEDALTLITRMGWELYADADTKHPEFHGAFVDHSLSASKRSVRRPAYERMMTAIRQGRIGAIVGYDLDRITRQPRQLEDLIDLAEDHGLRVKTLQADYDLNTPEGRMQARVKASVNANEVEQKSRRQKRANDQRAANAAPAPVRRVYGFQRGNRLPLPDEAAIVRRLFAEADAELSPNLWAMAKRLNGDGVKMSTSPTRSSTAGKWTPVTVRRVLTNPRYAGLIVSATRAERDSLSATELRALRDDPARWVASPVVTPIIERELFDSVYTKLTAPSRVTTNGTARKHFLTGVAKCPCGKTLICRAGNGQSYYVCPASTSVTREPGHTHISKLPVERGVMMAVGFALATRADDVLAALGATSGIDTAAIKRRLGAIDAEVADIMEDRRSGLLTAAQSRPDLQRLADERSELDAKLAEAHRSNVSTAVLARLAAQYAAEHPAPRDGFVSVSSVTAAAAKIAAEFSELDMTDKANVVATLFHVSALPPTDELGRRRTPDERLVIEDRLLSVS